MRAIWRGWPLAAALAVSPAWAIDTTGWTCSDGTASSTVGCGTSAPVAGEAVQASPDASSTGYAWVSTAQNSGVTPPSFPVAKLPAAVPTTDSGGTLRITNGATYTSTPFAAQAGAPISFYFNYVTSDGSGSGTTYADYAWARLLDSNGAEVALLFTARTDPSISVVPGNGMPPAAATLTPVSAPIIAGAPTWAPLGTVLAGSGTCFGGASGGCGYSGWVKADYTIVQAGSYQLEIGVVNWRDNISQSGLAVDGLLVAGQPPGTLIPSNPGTVAPGAAPTYSGTVPNPGGATTVDLVITGPNGYSATLQVPIVNNGGVYSYSVTGAVLPPGTYTVTATVTGATQSQSQTFVVQAPPPPVTPVTPVIAPVPTLGGWALALLGVLTTGLAWRRRSRE